MRFYDYMYALDSDRKEWLNNIVMETGLNYFGGKAKIGQYLLNQVFNMCVDIELNEGSRPSIFVDSFTGGGKMGLSIPDGWFDTIVMNDLNWGIFNFYKCCQNDYIALIKMIDKIGEVMCKDFFHIALHIRSKRETEPLVAAALTFWVTYSSFNGITNEEFASYSLPFKFDSSKIVTEQEKELLHGNNIVEKEAIAKIRRLAHKRIPILHEKLNRQHYIIENLDYRELIKKYNGLQYSEQTSNEPQKACEEYLKKTKLFYFDPPYHPYTLNGGKDAPYADTFTVELAEGMIQILNGHEQGYGDIQYFIKSDYSLKQAVNNAKIGLKKSNCSQKKWFTELLDMDEKTPQKVSKAFDSLEAFPFCRIPLGSFDKGAIDSDGEKTEGYEFIWCKGFSKKYIMQAREEYKLDILSHGL